MCTAKFGGLSIPDGGISREMVGGEWWRSVERTSQSSVPGFGRNTKTNHRYSRCAAPFYHVCGLLVSCSPKDPTACLPVLGGGGKAEKVWRVGSNAFITCVEWLREPGGGG